ncbi:MAG: DUF4271 domain-containing protein [Bacteroidetes bacterium]|nr:DUF4271 domain-containing protein [Bacteroidota bacterium]
MGNNTDNKQQQDTTRIQPLVDTIPTIINQDTTAVLIQDTVISEDTISGSDIKEYSIQDALQIFEREQQHQEKFDSLHKTSLIKSEPKSIIPEKIISVFQPDSSDIIITIGENQGIKPLFFKNMWEHSNKMVSRKDHLFITSEKPTYNKSTRVGTEIPDKNQDNYHSREKISTLWNDWVLGIIIISFILLVWIKLLYNKVLSATVNSIFNYQISHNLFLDKSSFTQKAFLIMDFGFFLNAGLFIYLSAKHFNLTLIHPEGIIAFLLFTGFVFAIYLVRYIANKIVGYVSLTQKVFAEYLQNIFIHTRVTGLVLLPFIIAIPYADYRITPVAIFVGAGIIILAYIFRIIRGIKIFTLRKVSLLYLFLYLCVLEFIPILVFFKYLRIF